MTFTCVTSAFPAITVCACVLLFPLLLISVGFLAFCIAAIFFILIGVTRQNRLTLSCFFFSCDPSSSKILNTQQTHSALNSLNISTLLGPEKKVSISMSVTRGVVPFKVFLNLVANHLCHQEWQTTAAALSRKWKYLVLEEQNSLAVWKLARREMLMFTLSHFCFRPMLFLLSPKRF